MMSKTIYPFALTIFWLLAFVPLQQAMATPLQENVAAQEEKKQEKPGNEAEGSKAEWVVPGIAVGESLPVNNLKKQDGSEVVLLDIAKNGPVALIFYRSASW